MFQTHQHRIAKLASTPEGFRRVVRFVHLTIQEPITRATEYLRRVEAGDMRPMWGFKRAADVWWTENYETAHAECQRLVSDGDTDGLVAYLSQLPGLGYAKAGFVAQLAYGLSGCLDVHNLRRLGIKGFPAAKVKRFETARKHAARYNAAIDAAGGCAQLWDAWCNHVADHSPIAGGLSGEDISAIHCEAFGV